MENKIEKKLVLNKKTIASLENDEMKKIIAGLEEESGCWSSKVLCGNTGLRTTCRTNSCSDSSYPEVCILCLTI